MTIRIRDIEDIISDHMDSQPYSITCSRCGKDLEHTTDIDNDQDMKLQVEPCICIKKEED